MKYMPKDMIDELKSDIEYGKIWGLKLVKTPIKVIENNRYSQMFDVSRPITKFDDECFYLKTRRCIPHCLEGTYSGGAKYYEPDYAIPDDIYEECEAYYSAFNYYDGNTLRSTVEIPNAVNKIDEIKITEYEVIRSY